MEVHNDTEQDVHNCVGRLRTNAERRKEKVCIGCGAGFGGDRPLAALKLLKRVKDLDYLVLECLAERTLAERYRAMKSGGKGYDPRISEWMELLLPLAIEKGVCIITNMGAKNPIGAQAEVLGIASKLGLNISVGLAHQFAVDRTGSDDHLRNVDSDVSVYLGAAPIVECLEKYKPHVLITSRVADAALVLAPMVYELGWNWDEYQLLAQGALAGHLLECGCQLTGGYFMHPGDKHRDMSFQELLDLSLPYAEVSSNGEVCVAKAEGSGGLLNSSTCAQQLLYEIGDPSAYVTPDVVIDIRDVSFHPLSSNKVVCTGAKPSTEPLPDKLLLLASKVGHYQFFSLHLSIFCKRVMLLPQRATQHSFAPFIMVTYGSIGPTYYTFDTKKRKNKQTKYCTSFGPSTQEHGWKSWGEISYGGLECIKRANAAEFLVRSWMEEAYPGVKMGIISYIIGLDSLKATSNHVDTTVLRSVKDVRLRMDGLFEKEEQAIHFSKEFTALYTNGPAGGGGISTGHKKELILEKGFVSRGYVSWKIESARNKIEGSIDQTPCSRDEKENKVFNHGVAIETTVDNILASADPAPSGQRILLYDVAHCRAGDKGNDINFSIIPHFPPDIERLKTIITPKWVKDALSNLLNPCSFPDSKAVELRDVWMNEHVRVEIYEVKGIRSLNVVVRDILDGGVNCSRRIDRHGKTISDIILSQIVVLPPP